MRRLLTDIVRRWWWLYAMAGAWSVGATLVFSQTSEFGYFSIVAYFFPLFYALFGTYNELKSGWTRVSMTMPVRQRAIGTALWISGVVVLPGVLAMAVLTAAGVWGLFAAVTRSTHAYRVDFTGFALSRR